MATGASVAFTPLTSQAQVRPVPVNFPPDHAPGKPFGSHIPSNQKELERYDGEVESLKKEVDAILVDKSYDAIDRIKFIDLLCRLGLSYHFQAEIEKDLRHMFYAQPGFFDNNGYDLNTIAIVFRVFRQYGLKMSSDVFNKFKDGEKGKFKDSLTNDPRGLLSLFEAAHLCTHGEDILDEALAFTKSHLQLLIASHQLETNLAEHIASSLRTPFHRGLPRLKAREFISFYQDCPQVYNPPNDMLLKFSKLDFNRVQLLHQQELQNIFRWWKDMDLASKLPYARDRVTEFFFWATAIYFEPKCAYAREEYFKQMYLITFADDTYESYGTLEELQILTNALERWDRDIIDQLPKDYMKHLYKAYLDTFDELEMQATHDGRSIAISVAKDCVVGIIKGYFIDAQWCKSGYIPSFKESLELGRITAGLHFMNVMAFMGMRDHLSLQAIQWMQNKPDIDRATTTISRLSNDIASYKREKDSGFITSPFLSYQRENNLSDEETVAEMWRRILSTWRTLNEELMGKVASVPLEIFTIVLNLPRLMEATYKDGDTVTDKGMEGYIKILFVEPIPL